LPVNLVLKFGGELLEDPVRLRSLVGTIARISARVGSLVIVHGGGKEIDAALKTAGIEKRQVDGLRITDDRTLDIVVAVLAGTINTRFVAALNTAGVAAVGLTGADGCCALSDVAPPLHSVDGRVVDLGRVGVPSDRADMRLLTTLTTAGFVPVLSSIGLAPDGRLLNVNADVLASHVTARLRAERLLIAGTTAGVLDARGETLHVLDAESINSLVHDRTASAGMVAKLRACVDALTLGAGDVVIADGLDEDALEAAATGTPPARTTHIVRAAVAPGRMG
jgi:acetylglutamate kinase